MRKGEGARYWDIRWFKEQYGSSYKPLVELIGEESVPLIHAKEMATGIMFQAAKEFPQPRGGFRDLYLI